MALSLDGSAHINSSNSASLGVALTTSNSNDIICVVATVNGAPVTSVTASGLTFTKRANAGTTSAFQIELWTAVATSPLTALTITTTQTSSAFITVDVFGISGADTSTIFDANAALPSEVSSGNPSISTDTADTFCLGCMRGTGGSPVAGAGWTAISAADYQVTEYQIVSSTQSGLSVTATSTTPNGGIGDAIIIASAGGATILPQMMQLAS